MVNKKIPLRFYGRSTISSLTGDIMATIRGLAKGTIKDSTTKVVLDSCWFCVKHRLMITGRVRIPRLGDLEVTSDLDGRPYVRFYCDPTLISELHSSLVARSPSLSVGSPSES